MDGFFLSTGRLREVGTVRAARWNGLGAARCIEVHFLRLPELRRSPGAPRGSSDTLVRTGRKVCFADAGVVFDHSRRQQLMEERCVVLQLQFLEAKFRNISWRICCKWFCKPFAYVAHLMINCPLHDGKQKVAKPLISAKIAGFLNPIKSHTSSVKPPSLNQIESCQNSVKRVQVEFDTYLSRRSS